MFSESSNIASEWYSYNIGLKFDIGVEYPEELNKYVLRGLFDKNGSISQCIDKNSTLMCVIKVHPQLHKIYLQTLEIVGIPFADENIISDDIIFYSHNAFDFLSKIYDFSDEKYRKKDNYNNYVSWLMQEIPRIPNCNFAKSDVNAIAPKKERASDVGYDLTIIKKHKNISSKTILYDTGIIVTPDFGYYTKIVPRSSLIKSGYMLTNSMGIIDGSYKGNLMICLTKIDDEIPDLKLPFRCCQLIIDRSLHYTMKQVEVHDLGSSSRGDGGFGSTDNK